MRGRLHAITPYLDDTAGTLALELILETEAHLAKQAAFGAYLSTQTNARGNTRQPEGGIRDTSAPANSAADERKR